MRPLFFNISTLMALVVVISQLAAHASPVGAIVRAAGVGIAAYVVLTAADIALRIVVSAKGRSPNVRGPEQHRESHPDAGKDGDSAEQDLKMAA